MTDLETCYTCGSLNISYRFLREENNKSIYEATCRDCGTEWVDEE